MNKKINRIVCGLLMSVASVCICAAALIAIPVRADSYFSASESVSARYGVAADKVYATGDDRAGCLFSASASGASVRLNKTLKGVFETDFRVLSSAGFPDGDKWNDPSFDDATELKAFSLKFTENLSGRTFKLTVYNKSDDCITPMAAVTYDDKTIGKTYRPDSAEENGTADNNFRGIYTKIGGTSFCNLSRLNGELKSEAPSIRAGFDPSSMRVYVYSYGAESDFSSALTVADLSDAAIYGKRGAALPFGEYTVEYEFTAIAPSQTATVLVYSVDGSDLSGAKTDHSSVSAPFKFNAVRNKAYVLPVPERFDFIENDTPRDISVSVEVNGIKADVLDKDGNVSAGVYSEGCYFVPSQSGYAKIVYYCSDAAEPLLKTSCVVRVFAAAPQTQIETDGSYREITDNGVAKGASVDILTARLSGNIFYVDGYYYPEARVLSDGVILSEFDLSDGKAYSFKVEKSGEYVIEYYYDGLGVVASYRFTASDSLPVFDFEKIPTHVPAGTRFVVPIAEVTLGGEKKTASSFLTFPDGSVSAKATAFMDVAGEYKLCYAVNIGGALYKHVVALNVAHTADTLFSASSGIKIEGNSVSPSYLSEQGGVSLISSGKGEKFVYNNVIDLSDYNSVRLLTEFMVVPQKKGYSDLQRFSLKFADAEDSANSFTVSFLASAANGVTETRVRAGAEGQLPSGLNGATVERDKAGGTRISTDFCGSYRTGKDTFKLYYDNAQKKLYAANGVDGENIVLVSAFADEEFYAAKNFWKGFTSGKVKMSGEIEEQSGPGARIMFISVAGQPLCDEIIKDKKGPDIAVDFGEYSEYDVPDGYNGYPYPLFKAYAFDGLDGNEKTVSVNVYSDYGTAAQASCGNLIYNGAFVPEKSGAYAMEYTATDNSGNKSVKAVAFNVKEYYIQPALTTGVEIPTSVNPGLSVDMNGYTVSGGCGKLTVKTVCINDANDKQVELTDKIFRATTPGNYTLRYIVRDFTGIAAEFDFKIAVNNVTAPTFIDVPAVPQSMAEGNMYGFNPLSAVYYDASTDSVKEAYVSAQAEFDGKTQALDADLTYVPEGIQSNALIIRFIAENADRTQRTEITRSVKVIDLINDEYELQLEKLFITENIDDIVKSDSRISFISENTTDAPKLTFINDLVANGFSISFRYTKDDGDAIAFESLKITLFDSEDNDNAVDMYITKRTSAVATSYFGINGKGIADISSSFFGNSSTDFKIQYNSSDKTIIDINTSRVLAKVEKNSKGEPFGGFLSNKIGLCIEIVGAKGKSGINITSIGNQPFTNTTGDYIAPQIARLGTIDTFINQYDLAVIPAAVSSDVIKGYCTPKLTVTSPSGKAVCNEIDISQQYSFTADEYGKYSVEYCVSDGKTDYVLTYIVTSCNIEKPTFELTGKMPQSGTAGKKIDIADIKVTNKKEGEYVVLAVAVSPFGDYRKIDGKSFTPLYAGKYTVVYYVRDLYYNYAYAEYVVVVA